MKPVKLFINATFRQRAMLGVSLIELMISLTVGLMIIAAIGYAYLATRQSFSMQDVLGRMQEDARTAFEIIGKDVRMAGFNNCQASVPNPLTLSPVENSLINTAQPQWYEYWYPALLGYENTNQLTIGIPAAKAQTKYPANFPADLGALGVKGVVGNVLHGDVLSIKYADSSQPYVVAADADPVNHQITLTTAISNSFPNEIFISVKPDCSGFDIFKAKSIAGNVITYDSGKGAPPKYTLQVLGGSLLYPVKAATYYIDFNANGNPALFRLSQVTDPLDANAGNWVSEELVEGVQDMQLGYAIDDVNTPGIAATLYGTANDNSLVNVNATQATINWLKVLGVRVSLLMVSRQSEASITSRGQPYALDMNADGDTQDAGESINNPGDLLFRKRFTTTIAVENRL